MNIQQFQYVLAVAEYRHFETAAEKCFVAQSTLSTMISKFEEELGLVLFNRRKKPVRITREGRQIIEQLKLITSEISSLEERVKELKGEIGGRLKIGCIPTIAPFLLPLFLREFSETYSDLIIELSENSTEEILQQLRSRELDIGIVSPPFDTVQLREIPLYREPYVLYNREGAMAEKVDINDLKLDNFWLLEDGHCMSEQITDFCRTHRKNINNALNIRFKAGSIGSLIQFVNGNKGKTFLPYLAAKQLLKEGEERHITTFQKPVPNRLISLLVHQHFPQKRVLELLRKEIVDRVKIIDGIELCNYSKPIF